MKNKNPKEDGEVKQEILDVLNQLLNITRVTTFKTVKDSLTSILNSDLAKVTYQLTDGDSTGEDIAKKAKGIIGKGSPATVSTFWKKWAKLGMVVPVEGIYGRMVKVFDLEDYGIDVPEENNKVTESEDG